MPYCLKVIIVSRITQSGASCCYEFDATQQQPAVFSQCNQDIPNHAVIIESRIKKKTTHCSVEFHETIYERCGDADIKTARNKKIDPALRFYPGVPLMITSNVHIKKRRGNGTLCRGLKLKLKHGATLSKIFQVRTRK